MGKVDAFLAAGLDLWFNSADHKPPHFHVEKPGFWEVRVYFLRDPSEMVERKWGEDPKKAELKRVLVLAETHRLALLEEWESKVSSKDPGPNR